MVDAKLHRQLRQWAARNDRRISDYVRQALEQSMAQTTGKDRSAGVDETDA